MTGLPCTWLGGGGTSTRCRFDTVGVDDCDDTAVGFDDCDDTVGFFVDDACVDTVGLDDCVDNGRFFSFRLCLVM